MSDDKKERHPDAGIVSFPLGLNAAQGSGGWIPAVMTQDDGSQTLGAARTIADGQPLTPGSSLLLRESDGRFRAVDLDHVGPAKVTSRVYREGYDRIFASSSSDNSVN
jgi:hypothetical protein